MTPERVSRRRSAALRTGNTDIVHNPAALEQRIINSIAEYRAQIYLMIHSFYKDFLHGFSTNVSEELLQPLNQDLSLLSKCESDDPEMEARIAVHQDAVYMLELLIKIHGQLQEFNQIFSSGELLGATACINDVATLMNSMNDCQVSCDEEVLELIQAEFIKKRSMLKSCLDRYFARAIRFEREGSTTRLWICRRITNDTTRTTLHTTISLSDLFSALTSLNMLDERLVWLVDQSLKQLVRPLLLEPSVTISIDRHRYQATLTLNTGVNKQAAPASTNPLSNLAQVLRFLACDVLFGKQPGIRRRGRTGRTAYRMELDDTIDSEDEYCESFTGPFSKLWYPQFIKLFTSLFLERGIPSDRAGLDNYIANINGLLRFEKEVRQLGLFPAHERPIYNYIRRSESHYLKKKRTHLLTLARDILTSDDRNTIAVCPLAMFESDIASMTFDTDHADKQEKETSQLIPCMFSACQVSIQTHRLLELIYETLEQAIAATEPVDAIELCCCARDLLHLHRAVVPIHWADELASSPVRAAIFYNDCQYIVHHLLVLGQRYGKTLSEPMQEMMTFTDLIPAFRSLGQTQLYQALTAQRQQALAYLLELGGLHGLDAPDRRDRIEQAFQRTIQHCLQLARSWRPILATEIYQHVFILLIEAILSTVMQLVTELKPLSATEAHQLRYLLSLFRTTMPVCFVVTTMSEPTPTLSKQECAADNVSTILSKSSIWKRYIQLDTLAASSPSELASLLKHNCFSAWSETKLNLLINIIHQHAIKDNMLLAD